MSEECDCMSLFVSEEYVCMSEKCDCMSLFVSEECVCMSLLCVRSVTV